MLWYLFGIVIFLCVLHIILNYNERARLLRKIPGPKDHFIIGNGWTVIRSPGYTECTASLDDNKRYSKGFVILSTCVEHIRNFNTLIPDTEFFKLRRTKRNIVLLASDVESDDPHSAVTRLLLLVFKKHMKPIIWGQFFETMEMGKELCRIFNGIFRVWIYPMGAVLIYNPEDVEIIMSGMKYGEKSIIYKFLKSWLGDGLLVSNGEKWHERRKILTPAFHFNILKQFCDIIEENSYRFLDSLKKTAGKPIDIVPVLSEFTLNSICETAMGTQLSDENQAAISYKNAIYDMGTVLFKRFVRVYLYADFIYNLSPLGRLEKKYLNVVHGFTKKVIQQRREYIDTHGLNINEELESNDDDSYVYKKKKKTAMLDLLLSAEKEGHIDRIGVQEEVDTFMFEGHDTTATGLTYCFMLLANHKDIQDKIVKELNDIFDDTDRPIKMEDLSKMKYLECCIKESLRLYPPVHFISRNLNEDTILSNFKVPAGTLCHILILHLHYRADLFKNPTRFDPDRFLPENSVGRNPYSYIPFSAGPRNCIGQKFAMMEMKIAVANVLRKFVLSPVTRPSDIRFAADLVLRNDGPVLVNFIKREKKEP